jgi:hypothetical protein
MDGAEEPIPAIRLPGGLQWYQAMDPDTAPGSARSKTVGERVRFHFTYKPKSVIDVTIAYRSEKSLCVDA